MGEADNEARRKSSGDKEESKGIEEEGIGRKHSTDRASSSSYPPVQISTKCSYARRMESRCLSASLISDSVKRTCNSCMHCKMSGVLRMGKEKAWTGCCCCRPPMLARGPMLGRGPIEARGPRLCRESFQLMAMRVLLWCWGGQWCWSLGGVPVSQVVCGMRKS